MSYSAFELSEESGSPVELYEFRYSDTVLRYTSADTDVFLLGNDYLSVPIAREGYALDPSASLKITTSRNFPVAVKQQGFPDGILIDVTIRRIHSGDLDAESIVTWRGRVKSASFSGANATITCDPKAKSLKKSALRVSYGVNCSHILYSPQCGVNREDYKFTAQVLTDYIGDRTNLNFRVTQAQTNGITGYFNGGVARRVSNGDLRMIVGSEPENTTGSNKITLIAPFQSLAVGETMELFAGCDLTFATCKNKFNNTINFGGFPYVPTKNPFSTDIS